MGWGTPRGRGYVEAATTEEGMALLKPAGRGNKFRAQPVTVGGVRYASRAEAGYTHTLDAMVAAGTIVRWAPHPTFTLLERLPGAPGISLKGKQRTLLARFAGRKFTYEADYQCWPDPVSGAETCVLDKKSDATLTESFFLRAGIFVRVHPETPLYVVMPNGEWIRA